MVHTIETEFIDDFDIDIGLMWDYILSPAPREDRTIPLNSDLRLVLSVGYEF